MSQLGFEVCKLPCLQQIEQQQQEFWGLGLQKPHADDEYKHSFAVPKNHTGKLLRTARPGIQSSPDSQQL